MPRRCTCQKPSQLALATWQQDSALSYRVTTCCTTCCLIIGCRLQGALAARPMLDIMIEGTRLEKLDALGVISRRYAPAFATALRRALQDLDNSVRVLGATVLAQQHGIFAKRLGALQAKAKEDPGNPGICRDLGQACLAYAESGLLEAAEARALAREAHANFARAVEGEQPHDETKSSVARDVPCNPQRMSA